MSSASKLEQLGAASDTAITLTGVLRDRRWVMVPGAVLAALCLMMAYGALAGGSFPKAMSIVWAEPWGRAIVMDVYAGLILVGAWIAWRETSVPRILGWWLALALTGNIATCIYVLYALRASEQSAQRFFCGDARYTGDTRQH